MKKDKDIELLEATYENGMIWLVLGSLISADSCMTVQECEKNLEIVTDLREAIGDTKIPEPDKSKITGMLENGKNIIERDLKELKKEKGN